MKVGYGKWPRIIIVDNRAETGFARSYLPDRAASSKDLASRMGIPCLDKDGKRRKIRINGTRRYIEKEKAASYGAKSMIDID